MTYTDKLEGRDQASIGAALHVQEDVGALWRCTYQIKKFEISDAQLAAWGRTRDDDSPYNLDQLVDIEDMTPFEVLDGVKNGLTNAGASLIWNCLIGNGTATSAQFKTFFNNAQAQIGNGGGAGANTAFANTQFDLQGASKNRQAMDATYPLHTDGTNTIQFRATFATGSSNYNWLEWGVFNGTSTATNSTTASAMLNRKQEDLGTKTSAASWQITVTLTLS